MFAAAALIAPSVASAQGLDIGAKAGVNIAKLDVEGVSGEAARTAGAAGVFLAFHVTGGFTFQPEILASFRGVSGEGTSLNRIEFAYLEIPVLFRVSLPVSRAIRPTVFAGPSLSFELSCTVNDGPDCDDEALGANLFDAKSTELGVTVGGGVDINLGRAFLTLEGRYGMGLTNLQNQADAPAVKNRTFSLMAGLGYRLVSTR